MMSQTGLQTISTQVLTNISQSKGSQTTKLCQLKENNKRNIFLQKLCGEWGRVTSSGPLFIFLKSLKWGESKWSAA